MTQQVYWNEAGFAFLKHVLCNLAVKKVILFTGKDSFVRSGSQAILTSILKPYNVLRYYDFSSSPKVDEVHAALKSYISFFPDVIIAIGGGSVLDFAKAIQYFLIDKEYKIIAPLIVIPTTAGSGSEATHFAVIYDHKKKISLTHKALLPQYVFLNSVLTESQSAYQTALSGADAMCQSIESLWNRSSTKESEEYALKALQLIVKNLSLAVNQPHTKGVRANMMEGAYWAGKAINITKTTAPHAFSYALTSHFKIPHGQAVAVFLNVFMEYNYNLTEMDCLDERGVLHVKRAIQKIYNCLGCVSLEEAIIFLTDFFKNIGLKSSIQELKLPSSNIHQLLFSEVNLERLENNPRRIDHSKIVF